MIAARIARARHYLAWLRFLCWILRRHHRPNAFQVHPWVPAKGPICWDCGRTEVQQ